MSVSQRSLSSIRVGRMAARIQAVAMPDIATVLRNVPTRTSTGGSRENWQTHLTTRCRVMASILSGGDEGPGAGQIVSTMAYTMTFPAGLDIRPADRVVVQGITLEVKSLKDVGSWNLSDSAILVEIRT